MTIPEAQKFIGRWRKILIPWSARNEVEALHDMEQSCVGICGGMFLVGIISLISKWPASPAICGMAFIVGVFSFWLVLQFRAAKRALSTVPK